MAESYKLFINTATPVNRVDSYTFYVNWESFLPKQYSQYQVNFSFQRNQVQILAFGDVMQISATIGSSNSNDQSGGGTSILGAYNTSFYYNNYTADTAYCSHTGPTYTNTPTVINYPTNSYITLTCLNLTGSNNTYISTTMLLFLTFTPIKTNQIVRQVKMRPKDRRRFRKARKLL